MIVMPANATGRFFDCLARETNRIGHLYSPGGERGPWPWFPYAMDNGCFSLWYPEDNSFDEHKWAKHGEIQWRKLLAWAASSEQQPKWFIVPDRPGSREETLRKWDKYAPELVGTFPTAIAVQDGMIPDDVHLLEIRPDVICVGGSTKWKWDTAERWVKEFPRAHMLRCNSPTKLYELEKWGYESCDGTGWNRGDIKQTRGLEEWARRGIMHQFPLWPHVCRGERKRAKIEKILDGY